MRKNHSVITYNNFFTTWSRSHCSGFTAGVVFAVLLPLCAFFSASGHAAAGNRVELTAPLKNHVVSLESILSSGSVELADLHDSVVVITFFASWCPPCRAEFKALNEVLDELGDKALTVVAVNVFEAFDDQDDIRMEKFLNDTKPEFPVLVGVDQTLALFGGINRIPTLLAFDQSGELAFDFVHARGAEKMSMESSELLDAIKPLL